MNDRDTMRLCLALAASVLFHALLLGTGISAVHDSKVGLTDTNSFPLNVVLAEKQNLRREVALQKTTSKYPKKLALRKIQKPLDMAKQKTTSADKTETHAPALSFKTGIDTAREIGAALSSGANQQYIMMRVQQFFSISRESANRLITEHFNADKMAHYQGKHCTLRLLATPAPEQGYEIVLPECDDPDLAAELQTIPWHTAIPLPSGYSLPYRGMVIYLNIGSYDVSIGLEPIVN